MALQQPQHTFRCYCFNLERELDHSPSPPPAKISLLFVVETFKYMCDGYRDYFHRVWDGPQLELLYACFDADEVESCNHEFYLSVNQTLESVEADDEARSRLAHSIVQAACEIKYSESASNPNFKQLHLKVDIVKAELITVPDVATHYENVMRESAEEYVEVVENGMVPTSEKAKETVMKRITFTGEEESEGHKDKRMTPATCAICLEEIGVGSGATQVTCSHVFHNNCIEEWLAVSHFCPICRFEFPPDSSD